jgi:hypothetical protein
VRGEDDRAAGWTLYEPLSYVKMIRRGSSRLGCVPPVFLSGTFHGFPMGKFWERFFEGFLLDLTYEDLVPLCLVTLIQQTL